jgi:hypothetical protein
MVILTKPKCLKPREIPRVVKENQIPKCAEISPIGQTGFAYRLDLFQNKFGPLDLSDPFTGFQRGFLNMSGEQYDRWNLNSTGLVRPCIGHVRVLSQICHIGQSFLLKMA